MNFKDTLYQYLKSFYAIDFGDFEMLFDQLEPQSFKKGEIIIAPGEVQRHLYFVKSGVQMSFFETDDKTHIIAFTYAPNLCAIPESFQFQRPSKYFLSCLSSSEMYCISFHSLEAFFEKSQKIERLFRKMSEAMLNGLIDRHVELHALSMEERFRTFCKRSPQLLQVVPHKYIASYLSIDPTNFSKLFNTIRV